MDQDDAVGPSSALRDLRNLLRPLTTDPTTSSSSNSGPQPGPSASSSSSLNSIEDFITALNPVSTLLSSPCTPALDAAIERYLPSIQQALLTHSLPMFAHALDPSAFQLVSTFFVPLSLSSSPDASPSSPTNPRRHLHTASQIARITYHTLPASLSSIPDAPTRCFAITVLRRLVASFGVSEIYDSLFSPSSAVSTEERKTRAAEIRWTEVVKALTSLPAKLANAVGKWSVLPLSQADITVPEDLEPGVYFDTLLRRLEALALHLFKQAGISPTGPSQPSGKSEENLDIPLGRVRIVLERLAAIGLFSNIASRSPHPPLSSFFTPLLSHIDEYGTDVLPRLFLPLPSPALSSFTHTFLSFLSSHAARLADITKGGRGIEPWETGEELESQSPEWTVKKAAEVLRAVLGPPGVKDKQGGVGLSEAWEAIVPRHIARKENSTEERIRTRIVVAWVGAEYAKRLIDLAMDAWTDLKYIRYSLYAHQFHLTHTLILALSLLNPLDPFLVAVSRRPKFLHAMTSYLGHPDPKIRRLGMLLAEVLSGLTIPTPSVRPNKAGKGIIDDRDDDMEDIEALKAGLEVDENGQTKGGSGKSGNTGLKPLKFKGMWEGKGQGREECRWLRTFVGLRDWEAKADQSWAGWEAVLPNAQGKTKSDASVSDAGFEQSQTAAPTRPKSSRTRSSVSTTSTEPLPPRKIVVLDSSDESPIDPEHLSDPLQGYAPTDPLTSRHPPSKPLTPKLLAEVKADPTLALDAAAKSKIRRPVYVAQLVELLKRGEKVDEIECGIEYGEGLVRAKRNFGTELAESAVDVARLAIGLNDQFHLDGFEEKRQAIVTALVACSPRNVAPFLIEQYFTPQYSLQQRSVMLTALAMGARELAGLPVPRLALPSTNDSDKTDVSRDVGFPSKRLPPRLHNRYATDLEAAIDGVSGMILDKGAEKGEEVVPQLARERRLRLAPSAAAKSVRVSSSTPTSTSTASLGLGIQHPPVVAFTDVAAEFFIMPLINRFWDHYRDATVRDTRLGGTAAYTRPRAGAGLVVSPMGLGQLLMTLALLVHAARHSTLFLAVLCPQALEMAVTIGARQSLFTPFSLPDPASTTNPGAVNLNTSTPSSTSTPTPTSTRPEVQVLSAALELALVSLDVAYDLDSGRTLARDKPELLLAAGEWAQGVFDATEAGEKVDGEGGGREGVVRRSSAGVVVKVAEVGSKWGVGAGWA